jgi:quaternary ammonium compound-resistance protein SugE
MEVGMAWLLLVVAGVLEIGWAIGLKYTDGFTRLVPTIATVAAMIASMTLLGLAVRMLPVGTAYAVWTGIGTVGTVLLGMVLFAEPADATRLGFIAMIVIGVRRSQDRDALATLASPNACGSADQSLRLRNWIGICFVSGLEDLRRNREPPSGVRFRNDGRRLWEQCNPSYPNRD